MKALCMSFDGDYQLEQPLFEDSESVWEYIGDLGSKWYFYPFWFIVTDTGKTIREACGELAFLQGKRVATVARRFAELAIWEEAAGLDPEEYVRFIAENY